MSGNYSNNSNKGNNAALEDSIVEEHISAHVHTLFATHVVLEYQNQVEKWEKDYINKVIDAEKKAFENHENVLKQILNEQQRNEQIGAMFAMMALSLVAGPALSWITGVIETRVFPKYFSTKRLNTTRTIIEHRYKKTRQFYTIYNNEKEYNQVAAKVFGELTANAAQKMYIEPLNFYISKAPDRNPANYKSISYQQLNVFAQTPDNGTSADLDKSLRTVMEKALKDEREKGINRIAGFALDLKKSPDFASSFLSWMYHKNPGLKTKNIREKKQAADIEIEKMVDWYRRQWAKKWLYFGNNPMERTVDQMSRKIEREIWALWILHQDFKIEELDTRPMPDQISPGRVEWAEGRNKVRFHRFIVERLVELDVVIPRTINEIGRQALRELNDPSEENPSVRVKGNVDDWSELSAIQNWAKDRKPEYLSGKVDHIPRPIGAIVNYHNENQ